MTTPQFLCRRTPALFASVLLLAAVAHPTARAQTSSAADDEAVRLSEFTVKGNSDNGYGASETMTGLRVATKIKDLPFTVNVLTSEFFEDFGMFELNDNVTGYISSFSGLDQGGGFTLRGYTSTYQLRDGFFRLGRYGVSNVDRIEIIKGANAATYGQSSPTGIVNIISKMPSKTSRQILRLTAGSFDTQRENIEITGPLGKSGKNSFIFTGASYDRSFREPFAAQHYRELYLAAKHEFDSGGSLLLQAEYFLSIRHAPTSGLPVRIDSSVTPNKFLGFATEFADINQPGPNSDLNRAMNSFTGVYEKRFNSIFSTRVAGNYYRARRWDWSAAAGNTVNQLGVLARGAAPGRGRIIENGGSFQADLIAHYYLANRRVENKELVTIDINDYYRYQPSQSVINPDLASYVRNITLGQPISYYLLPWNPASAGPLTREDKNRLTIYGTMFRHQSAFFKGRLLLFAGLRYDHVTSTNRDLILKVVAPDPVARQHSAHYINTATTPNTGINVKITPTLSAFASYARSFNPVGQTAASTSQVPNQTGYGVDYGIKQSLFNDKLNFTASGFYNVREHVTVQELDPVTGFNINVPEGTQLFRGVELDGTWNYARNSSLLVSYSHINAIIVNAGVNAYMQVGRSPANVTPDQIGIANKYAFSGALKGLSTNVGVRYRSPTPPFSPGTGDTYTGNVFTRTTYQWAYKNPGWAVWDWGLNYDFPKFSHYNLSQSIRLNISNVFNKTYISSSTFGEHRSYYVTYTLKH
jgi:iron complex outermembrane recepter protein